MKELMIPIMNRNYSDYEIKGVISELKRAKADIVLIVVTRILNNPQRLSQEINTFKENKEKLEKSGLNVGAWVCPTIGYGTDFGFENGADYQNLHTVKGNGDITPGAYCPLDETFANDLCDFFKTVASTGVSRILLEDDFTMTGGKVYIDRLCCCCEKHMEKYRVVLGEEVTVDMLPKLLFETEDKKYRKEWLQLQGNTLKMITSRIEKAVHGVDESIRIGLSANGTSYTAEGVTIDELARIIAGKNRPFVRTTGAPYWKNNTAFLSNIEAARLQNYWCGDDIDLYCEGDTYPRPRHFVSSARLECFHTALEAEGKISGILKYMIDYNSNPYYETGYVDGHIANEELYKEIEKRFSGGETVGLNVFENKNLFADTDFGDDCSVAEFGNCDRGYLPFVSQWFLCDNSIPTTYGGKDCASICFGANAEYLTDEQMKNGVIIDAVAAKILIRRGIDIGIKSMKPTEKPVREFFVNENDFTVCSIERKGSFYEYELKAGAKESSRFIMGTSGIVTVSDESQKPYTACYLYENADKQRFMVYSFAANTVTIFGDWSVGLFRNYYRQKQLAEGIEWLQGRPLPAMCCKSPELYILCKKNENKMTVGLWNFFSDPIFKPVIHLDDEYVVDSCYNCNGTVEGKRVILDNPIRPFDFCCFTVIQKED